MAAQGTIKTAHTKIFRRQGSRHLAVDDRIVPVIMRQRFWGVKEIVQFLPIAVPVLEKALRCSEDSITPRDLRDTTPPSWGRPFVVLPFICYMRHLGRE